MKKLIISLVAVMALFVSCSSDSDGMKPYDNTFYGNLIYNGAIIGDDAKCDVSIVDNVATVTLYAVSFAPGMPAMDIVIPSIACVMSDDGYIFSAENIIPLVYGAPVEAYAMSSVTGTLFGEKIHICCATARGTIVFDNRQTMPEQPKFSGGSYAGELVVGDFAISSVLDVAFNESESTVDVVMNDAKFAEGMPLSIDITLKGIPCNVGETVTFAAIDIIPYINAEPNPVAAYTFASVEGEINAGNFSFTARMADTLEDYVAGKVFEFEGVSVK